MKDMGKDVTARIRILGRADESYPKTLTNYLGHRAPKRITGLGDLGILKKKTLALFCSVQCPGNLILKTYDLARDLRDKGITVISGFHSPMEKECFSLLLRGKQPVVWCLAKRLTVRGIPKECLRPIEEGRLLILSPFGEKVGRATQQSAMFRNEVVAALVDRVFVAYAAPGGKTEAFCRHIVDWGKPLLIFDDPETTALLSLGARLAPDIASITKGDS